MSASTKLVLDEEGDFERGGRALVRHPGDADDDLPADECIECLAESLGGVESLIEHPGEMTHMSVAGSALEVPDSLVRLSVGIEDADDLVTDLAAGLERAGSVG